MSDGTETPTENVKKTIFVKWIKNWLLPNWFKCFEVLAITIGVAAFVVQLFTSRQEALARNWTLLATPASGNSGKIEALEYLASRNQSLAGIDLSCKTIGGMGLYEDGEEACLRPTYLLELDLSEETHGDPVMLAQADLSGANLMGADFKGFIFDKNTDFSNAWA